MRIVIGSDHMGYLLKEDLVRYLKSDWYDGDHILAVLAQMVSGDFPHPRSLNPQVSPGLEEVLLRMLARDPTMRSASAGEVLSALDELEREEASPQASPGLILLGGSVDVTSALEGERRRLARLLQDNIIEPLNLLLAQVSAFEQTLASQPSARMAVSILGTMARQAMPQARDLETGLHPAVLDSLGLEPALELLAERLYRVYGISIHLEISRLANRLPNQQELLVFRLAQDLLDQLAVQRDVKEFIHLWRMHRTDFMIAMIAMVGVIVFGILKGVLLAAVITLILMIKAVSNPHVAFLGRIPGTNRYTDISRHPDNESIPGILLFRVEASLLYFNVENIRHVVWSKILESDSSLKTVIMDLSTSPYVDRAGAKMIKRLYLDLQQKGILLRIAEALASVRDILRSEEIEHLVGHISRKDSIEDIVKDSIVDRSPNSI